MVVVKIKGILAIGFLLAAVVFFSQLKKALADVPTNAAWQTYRRAEWWVVSARCTQQRHVMLVACAPDGRLLPIEDVSPTDDRGHGLLANAVAFFQTRPFEKIDLVRINVWVNAVSIAVLSLIFFLCGMPWAACLCLIAGSIYGIPGPLASADAQATFIGEYCLIMTPIPWIVQWHSPKVAAWRIIVSAFISWGALLAAMLLRQANGLVGIACVFLFLGFVVWDSKPVSRKTIGLSIALVTILFSIVSSNSVLLSIRSRWLSLPRAHLIASHGIAHAFHQGLGTEENPWGITYDDRNGAETVEKINPAIHYGTPEYYEEMKRLYLDIVLHHPWQVTQIYAKKLRKTLTLPLWFGGIRIFWYGLGATILLLVFWNRSAAASIPLRATAAMEILLAVFLLQGVFIRPMPVFLYPAKFGVLMLLIGLVEAGMSALSGEPSLRDRS